MSLALWSFFWTEADWTPAPPPPPPPPPPSAPAVPSATNAGGGGSSDMPVPPDFWDVREAYLKSLFPEAPQPDIAVDNSDAIAKWEARQQQIEALTAERSQAIIELRRAASLPEMRSKGQHIAELTDKIRTLTHKQAFTNFMKH